MVSLIRNGTRSLYITTENMNTLVDFLQSDLNADEMDIQMIQDRSGEYQTIIFIANASLNLNNENKSLKSFLINRDPVWVLSKLATFKSESILESVQPGAHLIIMRSSGDLSKVLTEVQKDLGGETISNKQYIANDNTDSTIIALTEKPLGKNLVLNDFHENFLMVEGVYGKINDELRMRALHYLNIGIENKDWNEIEIRIYDIYGAYKLQYDRMMEVFDDLGIGLVLGESWSKDYPKALLSVQVYRVRFFTYKNSSDIKRILFGLEYLEDGTRIVDYDVYYHNQKATWNINLIRKKRSDRDKEAMIARDELFAKLSPNTIKEIQHLEQEIMKTRY